MKINIKVLIFLILVLYIYFLTPQILSDFIYGIKLGLFEFIYKDENNNLINYTFNHKYYDGQLMAYNIREELVKYKIKKENQKIYDFEPYHYLNNNRILQFSKFISSISYLLKDILNYQKRKIKICVITSIRNKIKDTTSKGNFLKLSTFTINPSDSIYDICLKCQTSIKKTQSKIHLKKNTTFHDFFNAFHNIDYIFNSWRDLSLIRTKNNKLLIRKSINKISEKDIFNLKHIKQRTFIILDFFDDKYIISKLFKF